MNKEILVVDDDPGYLDSFCCLARNFMLEPRGFEKPSEAILHIQSRTLPPLASFIDMKPFDLNRIKCQNLTREELPELEMPEQIHTLLKARGWLRNFYFMTAHVSEYDMQVLTRTGAEYFEKDNRGLSEIFGEVAASAGS